MHSRTVCVRPAKCCSPGLLFTPRRLLLRRLRCSRLRDGRSGGGRGHAETNQFTGGAPVSRVGLLSPTAQLSAHRSTWKPSSDSCRSTAPTRLSTRLAVSLPWRPGRPAVGRGHRFSPGPDGRQHGAAQRQRHARAPCAAAAQLLLPQSTHRRCARRCGVRKRAARPSASAMRLQDSSLRVAEARRQQDARAAPWRWADGGRAAGA